MENSKAKHDVFTERISADNVQKMGEAIALKDVRIMMKGKSNYRMYLNLLKDISRKNVPGYVSTDAYDLAQIAICFLCKHMGEYLHDVYTDEDSGKRITVKTGCYKEVSRELYRLWGTRKYDIAIDDTLPHELCMPFEKPITSDYTKYDEIMRKLHLTKGEKQTINCYMSGKTFVEVARTLSVNTTTVWKRRKRIQQKYLAIADTL